VVRQSLAGSIGGKRANADSGEAGYSQTNTGSRTGHRPNSFPTESQTVVLVQQHLSSERLSFPVQGAA